MRPANRNSSRRSSVEHSGDELLGHALQALVRTLLLQHSELSEAGRHAKRVSAQRAGLIYRSAGCHVLHDLAPAPEGSDREPSTDDLPERGQIRPHLVALLGPARADAKAGHHLVEHEKRAVPPRKVPQAGQIARQRLDQPDIAHDRLQDDRRDLLRIAIERGVGCRQVVERHRDRQSRQGARNPGRVGQSQRGHARPRLHEKRVGVPMIAAIELEDPFASGRAASQPDGRHRRFGTAAYEPYALDRRHDGADQLCQLDLGFRRRPEREARTGGALHGGHHGRVSVPENQRTPRERGRSRCNAGPAGPPGRLPHLGWRRTARRAQSETSGRAS